MEREHDGGRRLGPCPRHVRTCSPEFNPQRQRQEKRQKDLQSYDSPASYEGVHSAHQWQKEYSRRCIFQGKLPWESKPETGRCAVHSAAVPMRCTGGQRALYTPLFLFGEAGKLAAVIYSNGLEDF